MRILTVGAERTATADLDGVSRRISLRLLPDAAVGDYVLVHAGYAIEKIDPLKAEEQLKLMDELKSGLDAENV
jgi:hydrogenase expression/formation protein HypC